MFSVRFTLEREAAEAFADTLLEWGALSVSVEDAQAGTQAEKPLFGEPGAEPGLWELCEVNALFADGDEALAALKECADALETALPEHRITPVEDIDWVRANRDQFQPIQISGRIWIVPSWHADTPLPAGSLPIRIDPGAAFGTGSHPTTRLCLRWLEETLAGQPDATVLDYGCGSGILAIGAMKLGARAATGVDIDPLAIETARFNAGENQVSVTWLTADDPQPGAADIVVANILSHPLIMLAPYLANAVRPGGKLALSGILAGQADEVIQAYAPWLTLAVAARDEDWVCLSGLRSR